LPYNNPKTKEERAINATTKLFKIVEAYNEGTIVDWKNTNGYKWIPYKYSSGGGVIVAFSFWSSHYFYSGGLYFKSKELSEDAYNKFKDIYEDFWMI